MPTTFTRLRRLFALDLRVLDEVRLDPTATLPAILVAVASIATLGLGGWLWWVMSGLGDKWAVLVKSVVLGTAFATAAWVVWLIVATLVLNRLAKIALDVGGLLRAASSTRCQQAVRPRDFGPQSRRETGILK